MSRPFEVQGRERVCELLQVERERGHQPTLRAVSSLDHDYCQIEWLDLNSEAVVEARYSDATWWIRFCGFDFDYVQSYSGSAAQVADCIENELAARA